MVSRRLLEALFSCYKLVLVLAPWNTDPAHSALVKATTVRLKSTARALPDLLVAPQHLLSLLPRRKEKLRLD